MSRVIIFSREFPKGHPNEGEPTHFVEKLLKSLENECDCMTYKGEVGCDCGVSPKHHTIRAGNRWKAGDWFSPRAWSGKPYNSPQIHIARDVEIKKVWSIEIKRVKQKEEGCHFEFRINGTKAHALTLREVAKNDGLTSEDMFYWIIAPLEGKAAWRGQVICWNDKIEY